MINKKGMSKWIWILIILILIVGGVVVWLLVSGDGGSLFGGSSIPSPPALPN